MSASLTQVEATHALALLLAPPVQLASAGPELLVAIRMSSSAVPVAFGATLEDPSISSALRVRCMTQGLAATAITHRTWCVTVGSPLPGVEHVALVTLGHLLRLQSLPTQLMLQPLRCPHRVLSTMHSWQPQLQLLLLLLCLWQTVGPLLMQALLQVQARCSQLQVLQSQMLRLHLRL